MHGTFTTCTSSKRKAQRRICYVLRFKVPLGAECATREWITPWTIVSEEVYDRARELAGHSRRRIGATLSDFNSPLVHGRAVGSWGQIDHDDTWLRSTYQEFLDQNPKPAVSVELPAQAA